MGTAQTAIFWVAAVAVPMFVVRALGTPDPSAATWAPVGLLGFALVVLFALRLRGKAR